MTHTVETLTAFTERVKTAFIAKQISSPVHLCSDTQAAPLIDTFKDIRPQDWCFGTWRSSYMCLLKGVPEEELFEAILAGRSMYLAFKEQRIYCSSIVGGILPIALGVAAGIKMSGGDERVYCFIGDMTARTGLYGEFIQYARGHALPIEVVIEDNGLSTNARTRETWGDHNLRLRWSSPIVYEYERTLPHVGVGTRVTF